MTTRTTSATIAQIFTERWSSRMFSGASLSKEQQASLFEAARWAPSCFNEQPWFFLLPKDEKRKEEFFQLLLPGNQEWVSQAAILCFVVARRHFKLNNKLNRHNAFDAGAAWASLALQAQTLGLSAHAMAGYDNEAAYAVLEINKETHEVLAAIAIGVPAAAAAAEERTQRKPLAEVFGTTV